MEKKSNLAGSESLDALVDSIRRARLRVTEPRIAILRALLEKHGPFTVEEVHKKVTRKVCDLATIYRSLASLEKSGLIKKCEFGDGTARYELSEKQHHHHVICRSCKEVEVLEDCELQEIDQFAKKRGFTEISHSLEFFGICPNCQSQRSLKNESK